MKTSGKLLLLGALILSQGCTTEEKNYITQQVTPPDWQPPVVEWISPPEAELRGTVGLDVRVTDSSAIARVLLYVDGHTHDSLFASPYRFEVITDSLLDGVHLCEARAWDQYENLGISPVLRVNVANSVAQGPRLLWVPDSVETIQAAINAAQDFDTIRVRDGTYYETLNLFGKGIWIESEHGPIRCKIDAMNSNSVFTISPNVAFSTVRGFWLSGANAVVRPQSGAQCDFFNNIVASDTAWTLWFSTYYAGRIHNNLFAGSQTAVQIGYTWGTFFNNVICDATSYGQWNAAIFRNPLIYGYNLFWANAADYYDFDPGIGDLHADPLLDLVNGGLLPGSPAIDAGNPDIVDRDGTCSDIGPFGGPFAY